MIIPSISTKVRVRIRRLETLAFRKILRTYLMDDPYANYKMQSQIFQSFTKLNQKTNLIHLHIHLVETIALILHSKVVFKKLFWLKLFILKNTVHALNPVIPFVNKRSHLLK